MNIEKLGVWYFFDRLPVQDCAAAAKRIEALGFQTLWIPEGTGRDPVANASWLLANTKQLNIATGIMNIYHREPGVTKAAQMTLAEQSGDRFLLGLGVSHKPFVEGVRGLAYGPPVASMRSYLESMSQSQYNSFKPAQEPPTVIAALGPKMLELAAKTTAGAHPYFTSPEHTRMAREILGLTPLLCVEQKIILESNPAKAREIARPIASIYQQLPNYRNNWLRMGLSESDIDNLSDKFIDTTFAWGNADAIKARIKEHHDAGADHVCVQPLHPSGQFGDLHWETLEAVAPS